MTVLNIIPREPQENNRQYAYRILRQNIMTMVLPPGSILNENSICEQLEISRTPVHEALLTLKSEELADIIPQSGSRVTLISLSSVREGLFMRSTVEPAIYHQIAGNISVKHLDAMKENLERTTAYMNQDHGITSSQFLSLDDEFHKIAYEAAQKPNLWNARLAVCSHYDRIRYHGSVTNLQDLNRIHTEHLQLYEYLILGDSQFFNLNDYYDMHLNYFKTFFSTLYQQNSNFFTN